MPCGRLGREVATGFQGFRQRQRRQGAALHFGVAVDRHLAEELQQARGAVAAALELEQLRRLVDEARGALARAEQRVVDDVLEELQVGGDAANAELAQRAVHARARLVRRVAPGRHLHQQRIVPGRDHRAGIGRAAVEADAEAGRAAIDGDAAVVGREAVLRILRGDAALHGMAVQFDVFLARHVAVLVADAPPLGEADLRLDDVDAGHLLGDGVLDLDARVHLDEIEGVGVGVHEELHRAGMGVLGGTGELEGRVAQLGSARVGKIGCRGALDHLLVAPLHRAVALEDVHQGAMGVAQHLHLDVARTAHQFLQIHLVVAEGRGGLAPRHLHRRPQVGFRLDHAHAAPAAAPARLEHERIANLRRQLLRARDVRRQRAGGRHHRHAGLLGEFACRHLVAQGAHHLRFRPDEDDAGRSAGLGEVRVLREEAVAGMDGVDMRLFRHADDVVDVEVSLDRLLAGADEIGFVRLEAVQGEAVLVGIDGHRADAQFGSRTHDADGDFAAVGDEDAADLLHIEYAKKTGRRPVQLEV